MDTITKPHSVLLQECVEHWAWHILLDPMSADVSPKACPACKMYLLARLSCKGCPIAEKTGLRGCEGTPYDDFIRTRDKARAGHATRAAVVAATLTEIDWLRALAKEHAEKEKAAELRECETPGFVYVWRKACSCKSTSSTGQLRYKGIECGIDRERGIDRVGFKYQYHPEPSCDMCGKPWEPAKGEA